MFYVLSFVLATALDNAGLTRLPQRPAHGLLQTKAHRTEHRNLTRPNNNLYSYIHLVNTVGINCAPLSPLLGMVLCNTGPPCTCYKNQTSSRCAKARKGKRQAKEIRFMTILISTLQYICQGLPV